MLPKLAICALYLRVFSVSTTARRLTYGLIAFLIVNAIAWEIPTVLVCRPIREYWSISSIPNAKCIDFNVFGTWISLPHVISDLAIVALPLRMLWRTQMKVARKIGVMITFSAASM